MPSSFTNRNRFNKQATGENTNTWGSLLNTGALDLIDFAADGVTTISAGGSTTLTAANGTTDQARARTLNITAATAATVTIPVLEKFYLVRNSSSSVDHVITNGSSSVTIYAGEIVPVITDGTTVWRLSYRNAGGAKLANLATPTTDYDASTKKYVDDTAFASITNLPGQAGNAGKFLTTDGANASWGIAVKTINGASPNGSGDITAVSSVAGLTGSVSASALNTALGTSSNFAVISLSLAELGGNQQGMTAGVADAFEDSDGISTATNFTYDGTDDLYRQDVTAAGTAWASETSGTASLLIGATYANSTYVLTGLAGAIITSPDGDTWTSRTSGSAATLYGAAYGASVYVVVGAGGVVLTSPDLATWTARTSGTGSDLYGLTFGGGLFAACGAGGTMITSPDGVTWTTRTSGTAAGLNSIAYGNSTFVAVGGTREITRSTNGTSWTAETKGTSAVGFNDVVYAESTWVIVGAGGTVVYGADITASMTTATLSGTPMLQGVGHNGSIFVTVGDAGYIASADAPSSWTSRTSGVSSTLYAVAAQTTGATRVVVGGSSGVVLSSDAANLAGTLASISYTASSAPSTGMLTILAQAVTGSITVNTSLIGKISRDGGTTFTTCVLIAGTSLAGFTIYEAAGVNLAAQPSGTAMRFQIETSTAARHAITGVALQWN